MFCFFFNKIEFCSEVKVENFHSFGLNNYIFQFCIEKFSTHSCPDFYKFEIIYKVQNFYTLNESITKKTNEKVHIL